MIDTLQPKARSERLLLGSRVLRFGVERPPLWGGALAAVLVVAISTGLIYPLKTIAPAISLSVVYLPGVLLVSAYWGLGPGMVTALLSGLAFNFFHIPPVLTFVATGEEWVAIAVFIAAAAAVSAVADLARSRAVEAEERRREAVLTRARIAAAADEERRRVVRDLHDGAQQRLVSGALLLKHASRALDAGDPNARSLVKEALEQVQRANSELRELAHGILPRVLTQGGLGAGITALISRFNLPVTVDVTPQRFPSRIESTAYFVVSEALTNVVKHAAANAAVITARTDGRQLIVEVSDDGVGGATATGNGLTGLADRVSALDGRLLVASPRGRGTSVRAVLPTTDALEHSRA